MRYLSVCSGIEAATCAWHPLGWSPVAFSEIEKFPADVLAHHYPDVPNLGDMTKFEEWNLGTVDLLVGGTPCQSFSVAGLRKGLDDPRGNLMLTYLAIARKYRPRWLVWENVPGVLSSNGGRDFASLLRGLDELGYGWAYRVLDAQYIRTQQFPRAVPQRRRRVFVVGYLGDWHRAAAVLFERSCLSGNPAPSRTKKQDIASSSEAGLRTGNRLQSFGDYVDDGTASAMKARDFKDATDLITEPVMVHGTQDPIISDVAFPLATNQGQENAMFQSVYEMHGQDSRVRDLGDVCSTVTQKYGTGGGNVPITFSAIPIHDQATRFAGKRGDKQDGKGNGFGVGEEGDPAPTLTKGDKHAVAIDVYNQVIDGQVAATLTEACGGTNTSGPKVMESLVVRRLTPIECERLQGFPDNYTSIRKNCPDGPRYKALGNSMAVNVMSWIGERIQAVDELPKQEAA